MMNYDIRKTEFMVHVDMLKLDDLHLRLHTTFVPFFPFQLRVCEMLNLKLHNHCVLISLPIRNYHIRSIMNCTTLLKNEALFRPICHIGSFTAA